MILGPVGIENPLWLLALLGLIPMVVVHQRTRRHLAPWRLRTALVLRVVAYLALVLALSGLSLQRETEDVGVVFTVDHSASVPTPARQEALLFVRDALLYQDPGDAAGVVVFGAEALLEHEVGTLESIERIESAPNPHQSDLSAGVRLAGAALPDDRSQRIVLLSDGAQTRGDARAQVLRTAEAGREVAVVPMGTGREADVWLSALQVPARAQEEDRVTLKVVGGSDTAATGTLRVFQGDAYLGAREVTLSAGVPTVFELPWEAPQPGVYRFRAVIEPDGGVPNALPQNDEVVGVLEVSGPAPVLLVDPQPERLRPLREALSQVGFTVAVMSPDELPPDLGGLRGFASIVLSDVPAWTLSGRQLRALRAYVRDLGHGLVMVGGENSFGLGGYYKTPVEEVLPVRMDVDANARKARLAMAIAIDKSCSMGSGDAGDKLGMAKEAAIQTTELLTERDELGVISFDSSASWVVPLQPLADKPATVSTIASLRSGGGTDVYPALETTVQALIDTNAGSKHVVLISDGMTSGGAYEQLLARARMEQITLTTIAIGSDSDRQLMQQLADWGGGRFYQVTDPGSIPQIFARETMLATQSYLQERPFLAMPGDPSEVTAGVPPSRPFYGFVRAEAKDRATVAWYAPGQTAKEEKAPLLAHWQAGLGRSVAFTSDATTRWSRAWVGSPEYAQLWGQVLRYTVGAGASSDMSATATLADGWLTLTVDAFDEQGAYLNHLDGLARVVAPDFSVREVELLQVGPGRYRARIPAEQDGAWVATAALRLGDLSQGTVSAEAVQSYSPEYRPAEDGLALLDELGALGGGGALVDPAAAFASPLTPRRVPTPLWPPLLPLAALLLVVEVGVRRLDLSRSDQPAQAMQALPEKRAPVARRGQEEPAAVEPAHVTSRRQRPKKHAKLDPKAPAQATAAALLKAKKEAGQRRRRR